MFEQKNMRIFLTSDTHFSHKMMGAYCGRPDDFEKKLLDGFKAIEPEDLLIHLGDICIGKDEENNRLLMEVVKSKRILVKGNHDKKSNSWYYAHGWDFVCHEFNDTLYGKKILFSHVPVEYDISLYDLNIHGHLHNNEHRGTTEDFIFKGRAYRLISVEHSNYRPVLLSSIVQ